MLVATGSLSNLRVIQSRAEEARAEPRETPQNPTERARITLSYPDIPVSQLHRSAFADRWTG